MYELKKYRTLDDVVESNYESEACKSNNDCLRLAADAIKQGFISAMGYDESNELRISVSESRRVMIYAKKAIANSILVKLLALLNSCGVEYDVENIKIQMLNDVPTIVKENEKVEIQSNTSIMLFSEVLDALQNEIHLPVEKIYLSKTSPNTDNMLSFTTSRVEKGSVIATFNTI